MKRLLLLFALTGCTASIQPASQQTLAQFTAGDLSGAAAIATAGGDANGKECWTYMAAIVSALPAAPGIATAIELKQIVRQPTFLTACAGTLPMTVVNNP